MGSVSCMSHPLIKLCFRSFLVVFKKAHFLEVQAQKPCIILSAAFATF